MSRRRWYAPSTGLGPGHPDRVEAGPLSQWLHTGLAEAGLETVLVETRNVKGALSTMKIDRKHARGIAPSCCEWGDSVPSIASRPMRRRCARCWSGASCCSRLVWSRKTIARS